MIVNRWLKKRFFALWQLNVESIFELCMLSTDFESSEKR